MERIHIAVLAIVVAVVAVFGFKLLSGDTNPPDDRFASDVAPGMLGPDGTRARRVPFSAGDPAQPGGERRKPGVPGGAPDKETRRGGGSTGSSGAHGSAEVI